MEKLDIMTMKKSDFKKVRKRGWREEVPLFDSLVIIPTRRKHDSGYLCMEFVGVIKGEPIVMAGGCSDIIHIDGIGGYGEWDRELPRTVLPKGWSIDCLPCGYLRIFVGGYKLKIGNDLSSFEIYAVKEEK